MANILITNVCNRSCPYCFAKEKVVLGDDGDAAGASAKGAPPYMSLEDFDKALAFLKRSNCRVVSLLGGEPTIHPQFDKILSRVSGSGLPLKLFSNGLMRDETVRRLVELDVQVSVSVNVNEPGSSPVSEVAHVLRTLSALGHKASLSFNIYTLESDWSFLTGLILDHGLERAIRFGVAMPILGVKNTFLPLDQYREVGRRLAAFSDRCSEHDISVRLDCGFTACMFSHEEIGRMLCNGTDVTFRCASIIDIGTDLRVWSCFPLSGATNVRLDDFDSRQEIVEFYDKMFSAYRRAGSLPSCIGCPQIRRQQCLGGCVVHSIRSFGQEAQYMKVAVKD